MDRCHGACKLIRAELSWYGEHPPKVKFTAPPHIDEKFSIKAVLDYVEALREPPCWGSRGSVTTHASIISEVAC